MIVFITSVRHPLNSTSYEKVESLLKRTLDSICRQTDDDYRVIVACNQIPPYASDFPKADFLKTDFPPPSETRHAKIEKKKAFKDKASKRFLALQEAKKYSPEYVMFFDADDLLSNRISSYVSSHPGENGFYVKHGFVYGEGSITLKPKPDFHRACGSSIILSFALLQQFLEESFNLPPSSSQQEIINAVGEHFFYEILGNHHLVTSYFKDAGHPLSPLPFPAAIWIVNTGENRSVTKGISTVTGILVSKSHREEFLLDAPPVTPNSLAAYSLRFPPAILVSLRLLIFRDLLWRVRAVLKSAYVKSVPQAFRRNSVAKE
jgi:hypothetical protein